jgi:hypothetical protein
VTLGSALTLKIQSIGVVGFSTSFRTVDGILGIGPVRLMQGTISNVRTVPTGTDNLFKAGVIASNAIGIFHCPITSKGGKGQLTRGVVDKMKIVGSIRHTLITNTQPATFY